MSGARPMRNNVAPTALREVTLPRKPGRLALGFPLPPPPALFGCPANALGLLRKLIIAVVGCGSVGGRIALLLARLGIGGLQLVDPKSYKPGSIATHDISPADVGRPKALAIAERCKTISQATRVQAFAGPVAALDLGALADAAVVVMAPDLLSVEAELGQRGLWLRQPLLQASVHGPTLTAQIRFFHNANSEGGCPVCCYGRRELDLMQEQVPFSCEAPSRVAAAVPPGEGQATNSLGALCSTSSDLAVIQVLRFLLGIGEPVTDTMLEYNGFTHRTIVTSIVRNPRCKLQHAALKQTFVEGPLAGLSLAQAARRATGTSLAPGAQFELPGADWVEFAACGCAQPHPVRRFVARALQSLGLCPKCAAPLVPLDFYTHRAVSSAVLGAAADRPLRKLGANHIGSIVIRAGDSGVLIRPQPSPPALL
jgi:molybdopterin/thiamine biosynthesis adenylyltransferase